MPDAGYYLANATVNGASIVGELATTGGTYTATITQDTSVVATYAKVFDITFSISGNGTITPTDSKVYCAIGSDTKSIEYTFTPAAKFDLTYAAVGITDITSSLHTYGGTYTATIAENTAITAVFKEYVVNTATSSGGGVVNVSEKSYIGDELTAQFVPYDGFLVSSVTVNGEDITSSLQYIGTSATYTFSPTSDTEIVATFLKACRISVNSTEGGTLTTSAETVIENSEVTLTFAADSGYGLYLAHVGDEDITSRLARSGGTYTMTVAGDVSAFAEWRKVIKVNVEDYAGGLVEVLENGDVFTDHQTDIFLGDDVTFAFVPDSTHVLTKATVFNGPTEHVLAKADMVDLYERVWYHSELAVTENIDVIAEFTKLLKVDARCTSGGSVSWAKSGSTEYDTDEGYESDTARPTGIIVKNAAEKVSVTVEPDPGHIVNSIVLEYIGTDGSASKVETIAASKEGGVTEVVNLGESAQTAERLHITAGFAYVPLKVKVDGEWKNAKLYD